MRLVLYGVGVSVFVAKVRIALDFKGLAYEEREPPGGYGSAAYRAIVAAGTVPGLTADGAALFESNAILEFLEETTPHPAILPEGPAARARVRGLLGFHDARVEGAIRALFPVVKAGAGSAAEAAWDGVDAAFARLAALQPWRERAAGAAPSAVDLSHPCTVQMARMIGAATGRAPEIAPEILGWVEDCAAIPAVARSLEIHRAAMEAWLGRFR